MNAPTWVPLSLRLLALCIPLSFALGVARVSTSRPFRTAMLAASPAFALALLTAAGLLLPGGDAVPASFGHLATSLAGLVHLDAVAAVMLVLVAFIAVVIVRYSQTYLAGDAGEVRYARALLATLAAVSVLVLANNLLVLSLAWMAASLALHRLLTFYRDRPLALVAAHKKFLLSRIADACMLGALIFLGTSVGSLDLDAVNGAAATAPMSPRVQAATLLLVLAVSLKSAQLPFHGWLIQVMEAPTPVSALLHAGIVNIGGFVMIRLAPLMARAPLAQALLVVIGTVTAVVAALVMTTRVSVKVALAWSTCAQMGFMLIECGLGAWHIALLHLVAHSLYKAHAFLGSGGAVDVWRVASMVRPRAPAPLWGMLGAGALVLAGVGALVAAASSRLGAPPPGRGLAPLAIVLVLALAPLVVRAWGRGARAVVFAVLRSAGVAVLYVAAHAVAGRLLPLPDAVTVPGLELFVAAAFVLLFAVQAVFESRPRGELARALQPHLFAGLYLDELFTRMTFRLWPPRLDGSAPVQAPVRVAAALEAR